MCETDPPNDPSTTRWAGPGGGLGSAPIIVRSGVTVPRARGIELARKAILASPASLSLRSGAVSMLYNGPPAFGAELLPTSCGTGRFTVASRAHRPDIPTVAHTTLLDEIASGAVLDGAYQWLCRQRTHYPHNADVWDLHFHWATLKRELIGQLRSGYYRFWSPAAHHPCRRRADPTVNGRRRPGAHTPGRGVSPPGPRSSDSRHA